MSKASRLAQWKAALKPREIELSDGTMLIRSVKLESLVAAGQIPLTLVTTIQETVKDGKPEKPDEVNLDQIQVMLPAIDAVVMAAAVDPKVTPQETEDSIGIDSLSFGDKMLIFAEANKASAKYARFPDAQK